jgi:hypothetical protein
MPTLRSITRTAASLALGTLALTACASENWRSDLTAATPQLELVTVTMTVAVPAEEFAVADENVEQRHMREADSVRAIALQGRQPATPSQPCPPAIKSSARVGSTIKVDKTWFTEDKNENGVVCVKLSTREGNREGRQRRDAEPAVPAVIQPRGKCQDRKGEASLR